MMVYYGIGDTTVKVAVKAKGASKYVEVGEIAVQVKANADTVEFTNIPKDNTIGIGEDVYAPAVKQTLKHAETVKEANDAVAYSIDEKYKDIATVKDGKVTTLKAGEFELAVKTYQNSKLTGATATNTVKLTVDVVAPFELKQTSYKGFSLEFDNESAAKNAAEATAKSLTQASAAVTENKEIIKVWSVIKGTDKEVEVAEFIGSVAVASGNKKIVNVGMFNNFVQGTDYIVRYGKDEARFTAVDWIPAAIKVGGIYDANFDNKGGNTDLYINIYAAGPSEGQLVDITDVVKETGIIEFADTAATNDFSKYYLDAASAKLYFYENEVVANIKATFTYWDSKNVKQTFEDIQPFTTNNTEVVTLSNWAIAQKGAALSFNPIADDSNDGWAKKGFCVEDLNRTLVVKLNVNNNRGDNKIGTSYDRTNTDITFKSSNVDKLNVDEKTGEIYASKDANDGKVSIYVFYKNKLVGTLNVDVYAKRVLANFTVSANGNTKLAYNDQAAGIDPYLVDITSESVSFKLKPVDQLGDVIEDVTYTIDEATKTAGYYGTVDTLLGAELYAGEDAVTFSGDVGVKTARTLQYLVTVQQNGTDNKIVRSFAFQAKNTSEARIVDNRIEEAGDSIKDMNLIEWKSGAFVRVALDSRTVKLNAFGYDSEGFKVGQYILKNEKNAAGEGQFFIEVNKIGERDLLPLTLSGNTVQMQTVKASATGDVLFKVGQNIVSGSAIATGATSPSGEIGPGYAIKLPEGSYRANLFKKVNDATDKKVAYNGMNFTLTDSTNAAFAGVFNWDKFKTTVSDIRDAVLDCVKIKFDSYNGISNVDPVTNIINSDKVAVSYVLGQNGMITVNEVYFYAYDSADGYHVVVKMPVNRSIVVGASN